MGWRVDRRRRPSIRREAPAVNVVLAPEQALGAHEVHRLLENVRRGGALIFSSRRRRRDRGLARRRGGTGRAIPFELRRFHVSAADDVPRHHDGGGAARSQSHRLAPSGAGTDDHARGHQCEAEDVSRRDRDGTWARPRRDGQLVDALCERCRASVRVGRGRRRLRACSSTCARRASIAANGVRRISSRLWRARGSVRAVMSYLAGTSSGHFLTQALVAGLLLVLANAPRPIRPARTAAHRSAFATGARRRPGACLCRRRRNADGDGAID